MRSSTDLLGWCAAEFPDCIYLQARWEPRLELLGSVDRIFEESCVLRTAFQLSGTFVLFTNGASHDADVCVDLHPSFQERAFAILQSVSIVLMRSVVRQCVLMLALYAPGRQTCLSSILNFYSLAACLLWPKAC